MAKGLTILLSVVLLCSCTSSEKPVQESMQIGGQQYLLNAKDFDLQQVIALIRDNKIKDAADLEKKINEPGGINNVDTDHDSKIDYIKIKESRKGNGVAMEFLAIPSSTQKIEDAVTVATVNFSRSASSNDVELQGGYANHVNGHEGAYYTSHMHSMGPSFGEMLFLSWLFMPSRPYYYQPVMPVYVAQPVSPNYQPSAARSDVKQSPKPSSFDAGSQAPKRSFASARATGRNQSFDARTVKNPPPKPTSFQRPRSTFRGFRRR
jgi:hypothetical protein